MLKVRPLEKNETEVISPRLRIKMDNTKFRDYFIRETEGVFNRVQCYRLPNKTDALMELGVGKLIVNVVREFLG